MADTDDLVQNTLLRALGRLGEFEPRREGAFLSYLRQILLNQIRDEIRRAHRRPEREALKDQIWDDRPCPLEQAIGQETMERYERGLAQLSQDHREAIILRLEFGYSCDEIAEALGRPSAEAARQLVGRALVRLAQVLHESE
jgi:RNA polymerase sigma-70 factor (ECF subfamily)